MREDFQRIVNKKDEVITAEQKKASDIRELCDGKLLDLKGSFLELQKDNQGMKDLNNLLRAQVSQTQNERDKQAELVFQKDSTIDRLKEEIVLLNRSISQNVVTQKVDDRDYEMKSAAEFGRLKGLIEELKNSQVEIERVKMESLVKDREYLKLKEKAEDALDEKNVALKQLDLVKFENQKLKEEQESFMKELDDIRDIYESQIDALSTKLTSTAEETIKSKAKASELGQENNMLKLRLEDSKKRVAGRDVEIEKLTSHNLFELGGMFKVKPSDFLASPSMVKVSLENESQVGSPSLEGREDIKNVLGRLRPVETVEPKRDIWHEDKMKLEWDTLLHRISSIGSK